MKRIVFAIVVFWSFSSIAVAEEVFVGFGNNGKRYITWMPIMYAVTASRFDYSGPSRISKFVTSCLNDKYWRSAKMLITDSEQGFYTYKFKFKWPLNSRIIYVDIDNHKMSCRE